MRIGVSPPSDSDRSCTSALGRIRQISSLGDGPVGTPRGRDAGGFQDSEVVQCNSPKRALASHIPLSHLVPLLELNHLSKTLRQQSCGGYSDISQVPLIRPAVTGPLTHSV